MAPGVRGALGRGMQLRGALQGGVSVFARRNDVAFSCQLATDIAISLFTSPARVAATYFPSRYTAGTWDQSAYEQSWPNWRTCSR
jgi:hypothetical protein